MCRARSAETPWTLLLWVGLGTVLPAFGEIGSEWPSAPPFREEFWVIDRWPRVPGGESGPRNVQGGGGGHDWGRSVRGEDADPAPPVLRTPHGAAPPPAPCPLGGAWRLARVHGQWAKRWAGAGPGRALNSRSKGAPLAGADGEPSFLPGSCAVRWREPRGFSHGSPGGLGGGHLSPGSGCHHHCPYVQVSIARCGWAGQVAGWLDWEGAH